MLMHTCFRSNITVVATVIALMVVGASVQAKEAAFSVERIVRAVASPEVNESAAGHLETAVDAAVQSDAAAIPAWNVEVGASSVVSELTAGYITTKGPGSLPVDQIAIGWQKATVRVAKVNDVNQVARSAVDVNRVASNVESGFGREISVTDAAVSQKLLRAREAFVAINDNEVDFAN